MAEAGCYGIKIGQGCASAGGTYERVVSLAPSGPAVARDEDFGWQNASPPFRCQSVHDQPAVRGESGRGIAELAHADRRRALLPFACLADADGIRSDNIQGPVRQRRARVDIYLAPPGGEVGGTLPVSAPVTRHVEHALSRPSNRRVQYL